MAHPSPAGGAAPVARWFGRDAAPPGAWSRNEHWLTPVTPLFADFALGAEFPRGFNGGLEELALPLPPMAFVAVDGYVYQAPAQPVVPPTAAGLAAFEARVRDRHERAVVRRWRDELRPAAEGRLRGFLAVDRAALSAYAAELLRVHFADIFAAAIALGRLGLFCRDRLDLPADTPHIYRVLTRVG